MRKRSLLSGRQWNFVLVLAVAAAALLLLPRRWTHRLVGLVEPLVPLQEAATAAADGLADVLRAPEAAVPRAEYDALHRAYEGAVHEAAALALRVAQLEEEVAILTAIRTWTVEGARIGAAGQLIPARVISGDVHGWRDSRLVGAGSAQGVARGMAAVSHLYSVEVEGSTAEEIREGLAILLREAVVGVVEQAGLGTARVRLIGDVGMETKVRVGRRQEGGFAVQSRFFWLEGLGRGIMRMRDVDRRDVDSGAVAAGDVVLCDSGFAGLPVPMVLGWITLVEPDLHNPLLSIATVEAAVPAGELRRVYVYDPGEGGAP